MLNERRQQTEEWTTGKKINDFLIEHQVIIDTMRSVMVMISYNNYKIEENLQEIKSLLAFHVSMEDLFLYPIAIKISQARSRKIGKGIQLYLDKWEADDINDTIYSISQTDISEEINNHEDFTEQALSKLSHLIKNLSLSSIHIDTKDIFQYIEDRFKHEEQKIYFMIRKSDGL